MNNANKHNVLDKTIMTRICGKGGSKKVNLESALPPPF